MTSYESKVLQYLLDNYVIDRDDAEQAIHDLNHHVDQGETLGHKISSVAYKIADELELEEKDDDE